MAKKVRAVLAWRTTEWGVVTTALDVLERARFRV